MYLHMGTTSRVSHTNRAMTTNVAFEPSRRTLPSCFKVVEVVRKGPKISSNDRPSKYEATFTIKITIIGQVTLPQQREPGEG